MSEFSLYSQPSEKLLFAVDEINTEIHNGLRHREYETVMERLECTSFPHSLRWLQMREERTIRARDSE